jgi:phenylacetate-CoA ligase
MPVDRDAPTSFTTFPKRFPAAVANVLHQNQQLRTFERLPPHRQTQLLAGQLNYLLQHAKRHAPFWGERLAKWTQHTQTLEQTLKQVEPLTRKELQSEFERLSAKFPEREAWGVAEGITSGSTGTPVRFERCVRLYRPLYSAVGFLCSQWHSLDQQKPMGVIGWICKDKENARLAVPYRWLGPVAVGFERSTKERDISETYDYCAKRNPAYLQSAPRLLTALARYAMEHGRNDLRPEKAISFASVVTEETRELVFKGLGTKIIDRYTCEETGYIALQCPKHDHLHVISPVTMVEIVDESGEPCPPGKPGRVLVTGMQSFAMPLIRYEIGDMAEWGEPCDCGITLPVIKKIWGRTSHNITTPDGRKAYPQIYARDFQDIAGLMEYRFVLHQNAIVAAQLRVRAPSADIAASVTQKVQNALSYPYPVRVKFVEKIDWGASWKQEYFAVSDTPEPDDATVV